METYKCEQCDSVFEFAWTDGEAEAEKEDLFGDIPDEDCATICDDCFKKICPLITDTQLADTASIRRYIDAEIKRKLKEWFTRWATTGYLSAMYALDIARFARVWIITGCLNAMKRAASRSWFASIAMR